MAGGAVAATWEFAVVFLLRPLLAVAFVLTLILLSWYVAWRTVLVHVPLVQEITGLRRKKPVKPKPPNRGRIARFYQSQAEAAQSHHRWEHWMVVEESSGKTLLSYPGAHAPGTAMCHSLKPLELYKKYLLRAVVIEISHSSMECSTAK